MVVGVLGWLDPTCAVQRQLRFCINLPDKFSLDAFVLFPEDAVGYFRLIQFLLRLLQFLGEFRHLLHKEAIRTMKLQHLGVQCMHRLYTLGLSIQKLCVKQQLLHRRFGLFVKLRLLRFVQLAADKVDIVENGLPI